RAAILAPKREISASDMRKVMGSPAAVPTEDPYRDARSFEEFKDRAEEEFIEKRLVENNWNVKRTAELLGMQRSNLYKKIEKYGLKKPG
ncbi:MAG: helix-turn-helix domain-containing protein, partial [Planctomycetota bacterium]